MNIIKEKNSRAGVIGTISFHAVLLLLFLFFGMAYPDPLPERNDGIIINFGTSDDGMGDKQEETPTKTSPQNITETTSNTPSSQEHIVTQNNTETVNVSANENTNTNENTIEEPKIDENLANALNALNNAKNNSSNEGETNKAGDQGDINGDPNSTNHTGGGNGNGIRFSLRGRSLLRVKKPKNPTQEDGNVVVEIIVDKYGKVVKATPGARGSTTTNPVLYKMAKEAALKAKFNIKTTAAEEQKGQMTFVFILN